MPQIGPTGNYGSSGRAKCTGDKGGLFAALRIDEEQRLVFLEFGTSLSFLAMTENDLGAMIAGLLKAYEKLKSLPPTQQEVN